MEQQTNLKLKDIAIEYDNSNLIEEIKFEI